MRVTKRLRSDKEIIDSLQKITEYNKKSQEKSPRTILLQKISINDSNIPIKVQLLKTKKNNSNANNNIINNDSNSLNLNKRKIQISKNDINNSYNKTNKYEYQDNNLFKNNLKHLKDSLMTNNKARVISESPIVNSNYQNTTYKCIDQSPIKKTSDKSVNQFKNSKEHKIRNVLSKNLAYNKKKPNNRIASPCIGMSGNAQKYGLGTSRKNSSESNNSYNDNIEYGTKTFIGRDNYSVNSFNNNNNNPPKTPSCVTDIDSYYLKNNKNHNNNNGINTNNIFKNNYLIDIKLEDLILFEERLNDIIIAINQGTSNNKNNMDNNKYDIGASNESYEFFSFYFHSSLKFKFPLFFHDQNKIIIQSAINLKLFIIMVTYHLSMNPSMMIKLLEDLKFIYSLLKQNLYLFIKKLNIFYGEAFILQNEIYFKTFNYILSKNGLNNLNENEIKEIINQNCCNIVKIISNILDYYKIIGNPFYLDFFELFNILSRITEKDINNYFYNYLFRFKKPKNPFIINNNHFNLKYNINNTKINHFTNGNNMQILEHKKNKIEAPYITAPSTKKYTLVLDLENTLISHNNGSNNKKYNLRPGLLSFLRTLKPIYELISFTSESKEYSEQLLSEIESSRKYFDYNLYREHNILKDNKLVKDISKIGRDMKKTLLVDKLYDNIKSTPQNGILIKPYYGETNKNDSVLFELKKLLILFQKIGYEDLTIAIKNYANDIQYKITLDNYN